MPFFTNLNLFIGTLLAGLFIALPLYLKNIWYTGYLPFNTNRPYDRYGNTYNITQVVDDHATFVQDKYESYSVYSQRSKLIEAIISHSW
jgi:hypothetical protein